MIRALGILGLLMLGCGLTSIGAWRIVLVLWGASLLAAAVVVAREEQRYAATHHDEERHL